MYLSVSQSLAGSCSFHLIIVCVCVCEREREREREREIFKVKWLSLGQRHFSSTHNISCLPNEGDLGRVPTVSTLFDILFKHF